MKELAPIVIFAFNRPDNLRNLLSSLEKNPLWAESKKIVYIDGPRNDADLPKVEEVRRIAATVTDDVRASDTNKGLGPSIIAGVTSVINEYGRAIVIEDDLYCAPGFLTYMNQGLDTYADDQRISSICGYGLKIKRPEGYKGDVYLSVRSSSWGWATWADRWSRVDWDVKDYVEFKADKGARRSFNRGGSDMASMLDGYMQGHNRSWAIRFCYWQWRNGLYSVHPFRSLVENEGFGLEASNCKQKYSRFKTDFDASPNLHWNMPKDIEPNKQISKEISRYHSISIRIYSKIRKILNV